MNDDRLAVNLYEDSAGRVVVMEARSAAAHDAGLMPIGAARIVLRHLAPPVATRLLRDGHTIVEGDDALNVLLAYAHQAGEDAARY